MNNDRTPNTLTKDPEYDHKLPSSSPDRDAEKGTSGGRFGSNNKVGGRIAPVLPHLKGYDFGDSDGGSDILGKQIELEAGNDIQYRTCSWPKVCCDLLRWNMNGDFGTLNYLLTINTDCCSALFRVYLLGYYVLPIQLLSSWTCAGIDFDCCHCGTRSIHFARRLVCSEHNCPSLSPTYIFSGNFVSDILRFEMYAISDRCCSGVKPGLGTPRLSCLC
jgi:hypothetical protein